MAQFPKPVEGSWTQHYPELGTGLVSYEDSYSPEFYELERNAIFQRAWLNVGRVEQLPRSGSYFTRELPALKTSILLVRATDGQVRAFHNFCRHRGNKLVWTDCPREEVAGTARQFACKFHGWTYDLDGACTFVQQEEEFFDLDKARFGLVPVHCEVWEGFIFVNFDREPRQALREFLGPMITGMEGYPFDRMTDRYYFRAEVGSNWKICLDAFQEFYHAPVLHQAQLPAAVAVPRRKAGYEAPHYQIDGPHRVITTAGSLHRLWEMPPELVRPSERVTRSGLFGPWEHPDLGELPPGVNPGGVHPWGLSSFQIFPNLAILIWEAGFYNTYHYWPTSHGSHVFEVNVYSMPAKTARERIGREMAMVAFKDFSLQDANTLEATQQGLEARFTDEYPLNDQEVLCRHQHKVVGEWVDEYRRERRTKG